MVTSLMSVLVLILCIAGLNSASTIPPKNGNGYRLISIEESPDGGLVGHLQIKKMNTIYGPDIPHLQLYVKHETNDRLRVHVTDGEKQRWEVPYDLLPREKPPPLMKQTIGRSNQITASEFSGSELIFSYIADPFGFAVKRKSNGQTLFNSSCDQSDPYGDLVFKDQYLEISTRLPKDASLYGLGENTQPHGIKLYPNDPYTLYTTDVSAINLNTDLYGSHPVYMDLRNGGGWAQAHGVLLMNSDGMDVTYRGESLTYKVIGGVLDFYFFAGPTPLDVVDQYTALIGRPAPMPYWALGFKTNLLTSFWTIRAIRATRANSGRAWAAKLGFMFGLGRAWALLWAIRVGLGQTPNPTEPARVAPLIKGPSLEKWDDGYQMPQQIVVGLMDCMRQTGGAAQEGDPSLVSSAVSAIVNSVSQVIARIPDLTASGNHPKFPSSIGSLNFARQILRSHITCLHLLREALGERQSRVFEIALATEASSALAQAFVPGKAPRSQFQPSPETHDSNANLSNEILNSSTKVVFGRAAKITAAVSALVVGAILHGVANLERMVAVFRLKEGLDVIQFVRSTRSNANGNARAMGAFKIDNLVEIPVHWFRVLVGNCRTVSDGLLVELLGEASVVALSRMQRTLPLSLVFPPAYSIFAFVIWRPIIFNTSIVTREDIHHLCQSLSLAIGEAIKHLPFRDVCMRDAHGFYDLVVADATNSEFAGLLELKGSNMHLKAMAFVPLRARLFLNAIIDCKMPHSDDTSQVSGHGESGVQYTENEAQLMDKLVHILDTLQPAKFHWQWVELRLLLNEQALIEKLESHDASLAEAIRLVTPISDKAAASETESNFIEIILSRLLVRPDAAPLFSEVVHLCGKSLEDSMLLQAKWFLRGSDVLFGRKSIRQRLINIAESKGLSTKAQFWKPWGWCYLNSNLVTNKGEKRKFESNSLEEGEVVEEGIDLKRLGRGSTQVLDVEGFNVCQQYVTERALIELVLPCIDQSSDDSRNTFASELIKQMNNIEQQINAVTRGTSKQGGANNSGIEGTGNKSNSRKGMRGGSPGVARRSTGAADPVPPSPAALRASMSLRLQFLLRLLPLICADREPSIRNMRHMLSTVIFRLLGSRVVHEHGDQSFAPVLNSYLKRDVELSMEASAASAPDFSCENLFDRLLLVLHALLSSCRPSWLKSNLCSKLTPECMKDFSVFDREVAENLQNDLDRMQLPDSIRWRIQAAMPILFLSSKCSISCQLPSVSPVALSSLQSSISVSGSHPGNSNLPPRNLLSSGRTGTTATGKNRPLPLPLQQDVDAEIDPWTLLEDGLGSGPITASGIGGNGNGNGNGNLRASSWLKGAVRVRRTDLTYIGAVDDDS